MAHVDTIELSLVHEVRAFGARVFDLADQLSDADVELVRALRGVASGASRQLARCAQSLEERVALRSAEKCFKQLSDTVRLLDQVGQGSTRAVECSALAAEATELAERIYDLCI